MKLIQGAPRHRRWAPGRTQLFSLERDPLEVSNLGPEDPQTVEDLLEVLRRFKQTYPPVAPGTAQVPALNAEAVSNLRALGYVD